MKGWPFETHFIRSTQKSGPKNSAAIKQASYCWKDSRLCYKLFPYRHHVLKKSLDFIYGIEAILTCYTQVGQHLPRRVLSID